MKDKVIPAVGLILGAAIWFFIGVQYGSDIKALDMVEIFEAGKKEALRVSPRPSLELELTCANVWAGKVAPPEVLK